jgi:hypothetical protein
MRLFIKRKTSTALSGGDRVEIELDSSLKHSTAPYGEDY